MSRRQQRQRSATHSKQKRSSTSASTRALARRLAERTRWLALLHDIGRDVNTLPTWNEALHGMLRRLCESQRWEAGYVYLPDSETSDVIVPVARFIAGEAMRPFDAVSMTQRVTLGEGLPGRVYATGVSSWINEQALLVSQMTTRASAARDLGLRAALALPIIAGKEVIAVLELVSIRRHPRSADLSTLMNAVSMHIGRVLERERATAQMAESIWHEQQNLLHTLHDSLGQTLTGVGMLSSSLRKQLAVGDAAATSTALLVAEQARLALDQVRLLTRGLFPVDIEAANLMQALEDLATTTESFHKIRVRVVDNSTAVVTDRRVATQLYRIAQEAVTNAVKHAHARAINITVTITASLLRLRVDDDGIGIQSRHGRSGVGQRIMRHRASVIGGTLSIESDTTGTAVTLVVESRSSAPISDAIVSTRRGTHTRRPSGRRNSVSPFGSARTR
jgi:signal transduction histidine kinase